MTPTSSGQLHSWRDSALGDLRLWAGKAVTTGGVATFTPLDDRNVPVFSEVIAVVAMGEGNAALATGAPMASLKSVSVDRGTVTVNVMTGAVLGILGATMLFAPDGTLVHCLIVGV